MLSYRPAASVSVSRLQLSLHLDPCCRLQLRCTSTHLPLQFVFRCFLCSHVSLSLPGDAQCKLMCRSREQDFMVSRGTQFIDGTRCEAALTVPPASISACLGGKCQVIPDHLNYVYVVHSFVLDELWHFEVCYSPIMVIVNNWITDCSSVNLRPVFTPLLSHRLHMYGSFFPPPNNLR